MIGQASSWDFGIDLGSLASAIGVLVLGVIGVCLLTRSLYRLIRKPEKDPTDVSIVAVGVLLLGFWGLGYIGNQIELSQRPEKEAAAMAVLTEVTGRSPAEFADVLWLGRRSCSHQQIEFIRSDELVRSDEILEANNAVIRNDAALFEEAGWTLTRYSPSEESFSHVGLAFRAESAENTFVLMASSNHLRYSHFGPDCPAGVGSADIGLRDQTPEFEVPVSPS